MTAMLKAMRDHAPPEREPISLAPGEAVRVGEEDTGNPEWVNWLWCTSMVSGVSGWVPRQYLDVRGAVGTARRTYTAQELCVAAGDRLEVEYRLNGWAWCRNVRGHRGWVPLAAFSP